VRRALPLLCLSFVGLIVLWYMVKGVRLIYDNARDYGGRAPPTALLDHPDQVGITGLTNVELPSRDGIALRAWYVPSQNRAAVVVTSGTSANRLDMLGEVRILAAAGLGVLAFDWPGTGQSGGRIDWGDGAVAALEGAIDWLAQRPDVDGNRIGALGFSIGGMETVRVAATDQRLRAVILSGTRPEPDSSVHWLHWTRHPRNLPDEWVARYYGWPLGRVRPVEMVGRIAPRAVFLIGGTRDVNADPQMLAQLCAAAGSPKECWVVPGATHGAYGKAAPAEYARRLREFFLRELGTEAHSQ
jgi:dipeptidyl aminopeptidase/acylaminoacyl peptidase